MHNKNEAVVENKNSLAYPTRTLDPPITIVEQAKEIEKAQETIKSSVNSKLDVIVKQIRSLQEEAKRIVDEANENIELHKVSCNFEKRPGETIHLYEKEGSNSLYFSRLSPGDWSGNPPNRYLGSYIMEYDRSFKMVEKNF